MRIELGGLFFSNNFYLFFYLAASFIDAGKSQDIIAGNFLKATSRGAVSQDNILTYQASIDDLLTAARYVHVK
jgi:hypothetical protein